MARHIAAVIGCEPGDLTAGMRLAVEFHLATDEITVSYYRPAWGAVSNTARPRYFPASSSSKMAGRSDSGPVREMWLFARPADARSDRGPVGCGRW